MPSTFNYSWENIKTLPEYIYLFKPQQNITTPTAFLRHLPPRAQKGSILIIFNEARIQQSEYPSDQRVKSTSNITKLKITFHIYFYP